MLKNISAMRGARSVSDFTRSVACNMEPNGNGNGAEKEIAKIDGQLRILNERIVELDRVMQTLADELKEQIANGIAQSTSKERQS